MRTSSGTPPQNGCRLSSRRPCSKSKPSAAISRSPSAFCRAAGKRPSSGSGAAWRAQHALEKIRQEGGSGCEQRVDLGAAHAGLVAVEQRVVGRQAERLPPWPRPPRGSAAPPPRAPAAAARNRRAGAPRARASRPRVVARTSAATRSARQRGGVARSGGASRAGWPPARASSAPLSCSAWSSSSPVSALVSSSCAIWRKVAICSARTALPPGGIIT